MDLWCRLITGRLGNLSKRICNTEGIPKKCKNVVIVPLHKNKGDKENTNNYREIALLGTT